VYQNCTLIHWCYQIQLGLSYLTILVFREHITIHVVGTWSHTVLLSIVSHELVSDILLLYPLDREVYCGFQFSVGLFLDCLGVLKFLNQLHLKHFHLHHFSLFWSYDFLFFSNFSRYFFSGCFVLLTSIFFNFCSLDFFLLLLNLVFHDFFLFLLLDWLLPHIFMLFSNKFGLLSFLFFMKIYGILNFSLFHIPCIFNLL